MRSWKTFPLLLFIAVAVMVAGNASFADAAKSGDGKAKLVLKAGHIVPTGSHYDLASKNGANLLRNVPTAESPWTFIPARSWATSAT